MIDSAQPCPVVVKVGGSLFGMPDLFSRLKDLIRELHVAVVPGGGGMTDAVETLDTVHRLGDEAAHWLALRALSLNAHFLAAGLGPAVSVSGKVTEWPLLWERREIVVVDAFEFAAADESHPGRLPHCWDATSDSVAARVAQVIRARKLYLLKAASIGPNVDWAEAGRRGYVDRVLPTLVGNLEVVPINFREWTPSASLLAHERDQNR